MERFRSNGGGLRREFTAEQVERARVIKALHSNGATLSQLAEANLSFDGQAYVVYDGRECDPTPTPQLPSPRSPGVKGARSAVDRSAIRAGTPAAAR